MNFIRLIYQFAKWNRNAAIPTGWPKKLAHCFVQLNFIHLNFIKYWPIFKLIYCQNQENICSNTVTKDPTTPHVCRYTSLWNVSVLKVTIENKTSVTTEINNRKQRVYCLS